MTDLIQIDTAQFGDEEIQVVSAKTLFEFLVPTKKNYKRWLGEVVEGNGVEGIDYILGGHPNELSNDTMLSIDFAKSISMMSKTEKGKYVRKYFIEVEKKYKKVVSFIKPKTTIEMLEEAVSSLKAQEAVILKLNTANRQLNDTNARIYTMKAKETKTGLKVLKDDLGAEINSLVIKYYSDKFSGDHASMHRQAWNDYFLATNIVYRGAKKASLKSKQDFLLWLNHGEIPATMQISNVSQN